MAKIVAIAVALLVSGAAGYFFGSRQTEALTTTLEQTQSELAETRERERLAELTVWIGTVLVQAEQKNFTVAREQSTRFFDGVRELEATAAAGSAVKQTLADIQMQRDEVTADLAMGSERSIATLMQMFLSMQALVQ
jgi:uncharacterized protein HemX